MKLHIDCRCGCDILCIEKIFERDEDYEAIYYFNMYRSSPSFPYFWCRLKRAWEYFRKGEFAYSDMTIGEKDIDKMIEFLKQAKEQKENEE
jgi:hypothetical protein